MITFTRKERGPSGSQQREGVRLFWLKLEPIKPTAENCETEHKRTKGNREERDKRTDD